MNAAWNTPYHRRTTAIEVYGEIWGRYEACEPSDSLVPPAATVRDNIIW